MLRAVRSLWLAGIPDELVVHPAWGPYLNTRARRVGSLAAEVRKRASTTLPDGMRRYDDILTPELRGDLAIWWAATGVKPDDRSLAGPVPDDDREAAYHRHLVRTINARYGDAIEIWENRIVDYVGRRDEHTTALAKRLDELQRSGIDAELMLGLASARKAAPRLSRAVGRALGCEPPKSARHLERIPATDTFQE